jgi:hypothetical protein
VTTLKTLTLTTILLSSIAIAGDIPGVPSIEQAKAASEAGIAPYAVAALVGLTAALLVGLFAFVKSAQAGQQKMLDRYSDNSEKDRAAHIESMNELTQTFQTGMSDIAREIGSVNQRVSRIEGFIQARKDQS